MIRICITGWYGTETIGDRAICAGFITEKVAKMLLESHNIVVVVDNSNI